MIHSLFEYQAKINPENIALVSGSGEMTYQELNERANKIGHLIQEQFHLTYGRDIKPGDIVAFYEDCSFDMIAFTIAILKSGAAYLSLDPNSPKERLKYISKDGDISLLITKKNNLEKLESIYDRNKMIVIDDLDLISRLDECSGKNILADIDQKDPAYIIYTSGSTGKPKGVVASHECYTLKHSEDRENYNAETSSLYFVQSFFDPSVRQTFLPLSSGGSLVLYDKKTLSDPNRLLEIIDDHDIDILYMVPSALSLLLSHISSEGSSVKRKLKCIFSVGERTNEKVTNLALELLSDKFVNQYGMTEVPGVASECIITKYSGGLINIGKPVKGVSFYVLGENGSLCDAGQSGELYIGGKTVAIGYLNNPDLTKEKFIPGMDFYGGINGDYHVYSTGDTVRQLEDGSFDYIGRSDYQIKLRGFRIELGEIEYHLNKCEHVSQAVVVLRNDYGFDSLSAYYISDFKNKNELARAIKKYLSNILPEYMLPDTYTGVESFPLNANGKVDRNLLPLPDRELFKVGYSAPSGDMEINISTAWSELLNIENIGRNDDFFQLGGNSLLVMRLISILSIKLGVRIPTKVIFTYSKLHELAGYIKKEKSKLHTDCDFEIITPNKAYEYEVFPVTEVQQAYLMGRGEQFELGNISTHRYIEYKYKNLDISLLERSLNLIIKRHPMLRASFLGNEQKIVADVPYYSIRIQEVESLSTLEQDLVLDRCRDEMSHQVFDCGQFPLFDIRVTKLDAHYILHISMDILILDAYSMDTFINEWRGVYQSKGQCDFKSQELSFRDYVLALEKLKESSQYLRARDYWLDRVPTMPLGPVLPLLKQPHEVVTPTFTRASGFIAEEHWTAFKEKALHHKVSPTSVLLSLFGLVLSRWSQHSQLLINLTLFNRLPLHEEVNDILGDFTTLELFAFDANKRGNFAQLVKEQHDLLWDDLEHSLFTGLSVQKELIRHHGLDFSRTIAPVVLTSVLNDSDDNNGPALPSDFMGLGHSITQTSQVWLDNNVIAQNSGLLVEWDYVEELFCPEVIHSMHQAYCGLIEYVAAHAWEEELPDFLPEKDQSQLAHYHATENPSLLACQSVSDLFVTAAARYESRPAVVSTQSRCNYGDLGDQAARIAHKLIELGVERNELVAVLTEKGVNQVSGCLGVLQSGAGYLPLNLEWPMHRVKDVLEQGQVKVVLSTQSVLAALPADKRAELMDGYRIYCLDEASIWSGYSVTPVLSRAQLDDIAYVIFTSGSTGKPKGVTITHRAVVNTLQDMNHRFSVTANDRTYGLSSLSFDLSVYDIFGMLITGGSLFCPEESVLKEPNVWIQELVDHKVSIWNTAPMFMQMLVEALKDTELTKVLRDGLGETLRLVLLSGDWIPLELPALVKQYFPNAEVMSLGGATEASIWSILYPIQEVLPEWKSIPYGYAMANQTMHVLDEHLQPCPVGVTGEIHIGGVGVAQGYWRDEERTAQSFIHHPLTNETLYKTGDLGVFCQEGYIEFKGRKDNQVKVRGYRVELGEIESALNELSSVKQSAVILHDNGNSKTLGAYVVPSQSVTTLDHEKLMFKLAQHNLRDISGIQDRHPSSQSHFDLERYFSRKSYRTFEGEQLDVNDIVQTLDSARPTMGSVSPMEASFDLHKLLFVCAGFMDQSGGFAKYVYPSAGGLYPVQMYCELRESVGTLTPGYYYYHPIETTFYRVAGFPHQSDSSAPRRSAVTLHLVGHKAAIEPEYGDLSYGFCALEAGYMGHLLSSQAVSQGIGLESVAGFDANELLTQINQSEDWLLGSYSVINDTVSPEINHSDVTVYVQLFKDVGALTSGCYQYIDGNLFAVDALSELVDLTSLSDGDPLLGSDFVVTLHGHGSLEDYRRAGALSQHWMQQGLDNQIGFCVLGKVKITEQARTMLGDTAVLTFLAGGKASSEQLISRAVSETHSVTEDEVRSQISSELSDLLPSYMLPEWYSLLDQIPVSANGKVDRKKLPEPDQGMTGHEHAEPQGEVERELSSIWCEVLQLEKVSRYDDFFSLGGDSLLAMKVATRIQKGLDIDMTVKSIFDHRRFDRLAAEIEQQIQSENYMGYEAIPCIDRHEVSEFELSFAQERLWFLDQYEGGSTHYNIPIVMNISGELDINALQNSLNKLVERHEVLRSNFISDTEGTPVQKINSEIHLPLNLVEAGNRDLNDIIEGEINYKFDLTEDSLVRTALVEISDNEFVFILNHHHIISDGWSVDIILENLSEFYASEVEGRYSNLKNIRVKYTDFLYWQKAEAKTKSYQNKLSYWCDLLSDFEPMELPTDFNRPGRLSQRGGSIDFSISEQTSRKLTSLVIKNGSTNFSLLLSAFGILLSRYSGKNDIVIGSPISNRYHQDIENVVGFFANTIGYRLEVNNEQNYTEFLNSITNQVLDAQTNQEVSFEKIVEALNVERDPSRNPIFQVAIVYQNYSSGNKMLLPGVDVKQREDVKYGTSKFDLLLEMKECADGSILCRMEYSIDLFDESTVVRFANSYKRMVEEIVDIEKAYVSDITGLTDVEKHKVLHEWRGVDAHYPDGQLNELFEQQVERTPHGIALASEDEELTYIELNERANKLARKIRHDYVQRNHSELKPNTLVALFLERSIDTVVSILATLKAGAAYVPISVTDPKQRIQYILEDTKAPVVLTQNRLFQSLVHNIDNSSLSQRPTMLTVDSGDGFSSFSSSNLSRAEGNSSDLAYVIYTSGTTGKPKGVLISHSNVASLVFNNFLNASHEDAFVFLSSPAFDAATFEIWMPVLHGGKLVVPSDVKSQMASPDELDKLFKTHKITNLFLTKTLFDNLYSSKPNLFADLTHLLVGGEALNKEVINHLLQSPYKPKHLFNVYGPTESTTFTSIHLMEKPVTTADVPIGKPIQGRSCYVLDGDANPVPVGVIGELYIGGAGLASGYLNNTTVTSERFIESPYATEEEREKGHDRLYKTGDLVSWMPDGNLRYVGRNDFQVKIRGFRIELGEVESVLASIAQVQQAIVMVKEHCDSKYLVAYVILESEISNDDMRSILAEKLPDYMVPSLFMQIDSVPVTANGKLNYKALPSPKFTGSNGGTPSTTLEKQLCAIWQELLGIDDIGIYDNFFNLGGHSLLAIKLNTLISKQLEVSFPVGAIFENQTIRELSKFIDNQSDNNGEYSKIEEITLDASEAKSSFPVTEVQQAYMLGRSSTFELGGVGAHAYNEYIYNYLDHQALERALNKLIQRHSMLRVCFDEKTNSQKVSDPFEYHIQYQDLSTLTENEQKERLELWRDELSHQVFDIDRSPLFDFRLSKTREVYILHVSYDALIFDGMSTEIFFKEWKAFYNNPGLLLPELNLTFRDYVIALERLKASSQYHRARDYWLGRVPQMPLGPVLPLLKQPHEVKKPSFARAIASISAEHWSVFKKKALHHKVSPTSVLLTLFGTVLARWSQRPQLLINLTLFNRLPLHEEVNEILGDFTTLELFAFDATKQDGFAQFVKAQHDLLWQDLEHSLFTGLSVQKELIRHHDLDFSRTVAPVVLTSVLNESDDNYSSVLSNEFMGVGHSITQTSQVWLDNKAYEKDGKFIAEWDYVEELFCPELIQSMHHAYCRLIEHVATHSWDEKLPEILPEKDQQKWANYHATKNPSVLAQQTLSDLFVAAASRYEGRVAVKAGSSHCHYGELSQKAARIAHKLVDLGTERNELVAVLTEKGVNQVSGCLGVVQAGAGYLPLNLEWPVHRIKDVLEQGQVTVLLSTQSVLDTLPTEHRAELEESYDIYCLDEERIWSDYPITPLVSRAQLDDIAYVIFTSGSTGKPKGVTITHRAVVNTLQDMNHRFSVTEDDRTYALSSLSFDLSVYDIFGMLISGGSLFCPEESVLKEPNVWIQELVDNQVSIWNTAPMFMQMLVEALKDTELTTEQCEALGKTLRLVLLSGDWIPLELPALVKQYFPNTEVISLGGATEASIWSILFPIQEVLPEWKSIPYGYAMANQTMQVLDEHLQPCPVGVTGEIHIGGVGVAQGYWRDAERTAQSFIHHPLTNETLYKTGDLGVFCQEGYIEFKGRKDNQVKVRGYRVELGEIESALNDLATVKQSAVILHDNGNSKTLGAYVVPTQQLNALDHDKLIFKLAQHNLREVTGAHDAYTGTQRAFDLERYFSRKSYRTFESGQLNVTDILQTLNHTLSEIGSTSPADARFDLEELLFACAGFADQNGGFAKYLYPSAGGLYPVQLYCEVHESVGDITPGYYYYHPLENTLHRIAGIGHKGEESISPRSAVTLHLVGRKAAIEPEYGDLSYGFCALEAGYMEYLLSTQAMTQGIGLERREHSEASTLLAQIHQPEDWLLGSFSVINDTVSPILDNSELAVYVQLFNHIGELEPGCYQLTDNTLMRCDALQEMVDLSSLDESDPLHGSDFVVTLHGADTAENYRYAGTLSQHWMQQGADTQVGFCVLGKVTITEDARSMLGDNAVLTFLAGGKVSQEQQASRAVSETHSLTEEEVRSQISSELSNLLPSYMLPEWYSFLERIPVSANGKVDRKKLPEPDQGVTRGEHTEPEGEVEQALSNIWCEVLQLEKVSRYDDFFALGGDSLLAMKVATRIQKGLDIDITVKSIFDNRRFDLLAWEIEQQIQSDNYMGYEAIPCIDRNEVSEFELSFAQERLWFLEQSYDTGARYNIAIILKIKGDLSILSLEKAIDQLVKRHESFRTEFFTNESGISLQRVHSNLSVKIDTIELLSENEINQHIDNEVYKSFDLTCAPLCRVKLLKLKDENILIFNHHHIISDGFSCGLIVKELQSLYENPTSSFLIEPNGVDVQYADYAHWQKNRANKSSHKEKIAYWKNLLSGYQRLSLPLDKHRPANPTYKAGILNFDLNVEVIDRLSSIAQESGGSLYSSLLSAFSVFLSKVSGQDDITFGGFVANRYHYNLEGIIGYFANTIVHRHSINQNDGFHSHLRSVISQVNKSLTHEDVQFNEILDEVEWSRKSGEHNLINVVFAFHDESFKPNIEIGKFDTEYYSKDNLGDFIDLDLKFEVSPSEKGYALKVSYSKDLFFEETVHLFVDYFKSTLESVAKNDFEKIKNLNVAKYGLEKDAFRAQFDNVSMELVDKSILHLFEEVAASCPNKVAIVHNNQKFTYGEIDRRANQLSRYLHETVEANDYGKERIISFYMDQSILSIISILAIHKIGYAYLPLDISVPEGRVVDILNDCACGVLLTNLSAENEMSSINTIKDVNLIVLDSRDTVESINAQSGGKIDVNVTLSDIAYLIYTSGSTGKPKGVKVSQGNLSNYIQSMMSVINMDIVESYGLVSSISADLGYTTLYSSLVRGKSLHLIDKEISIDAVELSQYVVNNEIDCLKIVPSHLQGLISSSNDYEFLPRKVLILGGETLEGKLLKTIKDHTPILQVYNHYGPTETTIGVCVYDCNNLDVLGWGRGSIPIGKPLPNSQAYILDENGNLCPPGIIGELYIGGLGVTQGYMARPELTQEKFIENPVSCDVFDNRDVVFKTGDRVKLLKDGCIEYIGRNDSQIKVRGYRVELNEISQILATHDDIEHCVTLYDKGAIRTYYTTDMFSPESYELKDFLSERVPSYMLPVNYINLDAIPLTANGKVDRVALLSIASETEAEISDTIHTQPSNPTEERLKELWEQVVGSSTFGVSDGFFESGGHSILAIQLVTLINKEYGTNYSTIWVFTHDTIEKQACSIHDENDFTSEFKDVVSYNEDGNNLPIVLIHDSLGGAEVYHNLVNELDDNQPIYIVEPYNLYNDIKIMSIDRLSDVYIDKILDILPSNKFSIGGWSLGGVIAHEMARKLNERGVCLGQVYLIDSIVSEDKKETNVSDFNSLMSLLPNDYGDLYENLSDSDKEKIVENARSSFQMLSNYTSGTYNGDVTIFKARRNNYFNLTNDLEVNSSNCQVLSLDADHFSIMKGNCIRNISNYIREVQQSLNVEGGNEL
ncbi:amino acid adenylation domain-containing protein [Vibrio profundum]